MRLRVRIRDPRWEARDRYAAGVIQEFHDYTGDIVPRFRWLDENWFVLKEDDGTTRILHKDNIICGWTAPSGKSTLEQRYVCIPGKSGKQHVVSLSDNGLHFKCDCTGYGYRRKCSHVDEVMAA